MYALGMTQHTIGVQNIRCFTIMQLLKGNIGIPGGGIIAMRGQPNVQASTDFGIEFNMQPGYLVAPTHKTNTLAKWTDAFGTFRRKWYVNMTKAWFGEHATAENDYGFNYGAIRNGNHPDSIYAIFEDAWRGTMHALYLCGQNPHVTNANAGLVHDGLCKMDSLIVQDIFINETAEFWNRPSDNPADIQTEVIFLPACSYLEREGSITNSMRLIQWRMKGPDTLGDSKPDYEINDMLWKRIRELYADSAETKDDPIKFMTWDYREDHYLEDIMKEISGYDVATGTVVNGIGELKDNGETASGMWIYAGYYGRKGNMTARAVRKTRAMSASSRSSAGHGRTTSTSSTTALRASQTAAPQTKSIRLSGGMRQRASGRATMCRMSAIARPVPRRRQARSRSA